MSGWFRGRDRGFTIVELLVAISIIAVLIAISLPALSAARRRAAEIELLSNQRESMRLLSMYTADNQGSFPFFGEVHGNAAVIEWKGRTLELQYWNQPEYWGLYLASRGYEEAWVTKGPKSDPGAFGDDRVDPACPSCGWDPRSWHTLTFTVFAKPGYFRPDPPSDSSSNDPQRRDAIAFPAQKGVLRWRVRLLHRDQPESRKWQVVHFDDEHGVIVRYTKLRPGAWDRPGEKLWTINATLDGVRGRDM